MSRFNELCSICSKQGFGPTVKCVYESCETSFHVECARMNKHQLETSNFASSEMKFKIYCKLHTPHYLLNAIEARRKKNKEEIIKFANLLKKCYTEFFDDNLFDYKLNNYNTNENLVLLKKKRKHNDDIDQYCKVVQGEKKEIILESNKDHMYVKLNKRQRRHLLHNIRQIYNKYNNMNIPVQIKTLKSFSRHCDGDFQSINNCQASEFGHAAKVSLHSYDSLFFNQMKNRNNSIGSCKFKRMSKQILDSIEFTPINCIDNSDRKTKNSRRSSVDYMIDQAQSKIPSKVNENKDNFQFTIINKVNKFNKKEMSYKDTLNPKIFPWYLIDNISRVTPKQAYLAYKHLICPDEITFMKKIQQKSDEEIQRKKNLLLRTVTYEVESENKIICYCKSPALSKGGLIVNCYNESYCVNGGWFHQQCIEELKNLRPWEISRSDFIFTCRECQQKLKEANDSLSIFIEINDDSYNDSKSDGRFSNNHSNKEPDNHRIPCGNRTDKNKNTINSILSPQMDFYLDLSIEEDESNSDTMNEQDEVDSTKQNNIIMIPLNDSDIDESGNLIIKDRNEIDYTNSSDDVYSHYAHYETESISCKSILKSYSRPLIAYSCSSGVCNMNKSLKEQNNDADLQEDNAINSPKSSKKPSALNLSICNSNFEYIGKDNSATKIYNESENENKNIITDFTVNEDSNANTIKPKERKIFEIINTKPQKVFQVEKTGSLCKSKLEINNEERSLKDEENKSSRGVNSSKIENKNFSDIIGNKSIKSAKSFFDFDNNSKKSDISAQEIKAQKQESFQSHFQPLPNKEKYFLVVKDNGRRLPTTKITKYFKEKKKVRKIFKCSNSNSKSNEKAIQIVDLNLQTN